jgi:hypothetical protein
MSGDLITGCTVHDCNQVNVNGRDESTGAWGASILVSSCYSSKVQYCNVYHNWGEGIGMYSMDASEETGDRGRNIVQNNTVGDDYSGNIYIADSENDDVWNNFVYDDGNTLLRNGYPNLGIAVCDENPNMLVYGCTICNNIVVGGINCFRYANSQLFGGFYNGGMNNFQIYNNVFYGSVQATVYINSDNGNNFTWENNITWQPTQNVACGADNQGTSPNGGYGTQVISNNCWVYSGGTSNMGGSGDLDYSYNTNPGFTESGGNIYSANFWTLASGYSVNTAGTNKTSTGWFTFDRNWASRPSSGAWSMGAYVGSGTSKTSTTTTLTSSLNPSTSGASVTFTATVSPSVPNGETVTFYNGGASIGTGTTSSSHATLTTSALPVGSDSITAAYAGDSSYNASTSGVLTQVVNGSGFSGYYRLKCRGSQLSLSTNNSNSAGTVLIQDTDEPGWYDQEFTITATGDGYYYLTCRGSQLNLSTNNSNSAGTAVIQDTKESGWWDQEFLMTPTGDGYYYVTCRGSQLNFSTNNSNSAGTTVIQDTQETGWWDQEFQLIAD